MKYETREALTGKVHWEGGLQDALAYGITASDMPDAELAQAWQAMADAWGPFVAAMTVVQRLMDQR